MRSVSNDLFKAKQDAKIRNIYSWFTRLWLRSKRLSFVLPSRSTNRAAIWSGCALLPSAASSELLSRAATRADPAMLKQHASGSRYWHASCRCNCSADGLKVATRLTGSAGRRVLHNLPSFASVSSAELAAIWYSAYSSNACVAVCFADPNGRSALGSCLTAHSRQAILPCALSSGHGGKRSNSTSSRKIESIARKQAVCAVSTGQVEPMQVLACTLQSRSFSSDLPPPRLSACLGRAQFSSQHMRPALNLISRDCGGSP